MRLAGEDELLKAGFFSSRAEVACCEAERRRGQSSPQLHALCLSRRQTQGDLWFWHWQGCDLHKYKHT